MVTALVAGGLAAAGASAAGAATAGIVGAGLAAGASSALSSRAQSKASKSLRSGQQGALSAAREATDQAKGDVNRLFGTAQDARAQGFSSAQDFLSQSIGKQVSPFQIGNTQAQEQISRGLPQIQNAILGRPVDLSGFKARQIGQPQDFNFEPSQPAAQAATSVNNTIVQPSSIQEQIEAQQAQIEAQKFDLQQFRDNFRPIGAAFRDGRFVLNNSGGQ